MKCVLEELAPSTLVMFTYESPDDTHLNIKLYDPDGTEIYADTDKSKGSHGFTTEKEGDYKGGGSMGRSPPRKRKKKTFFLLKMKKKKRAASQTLYETACAMSE